MGVFVDNPNLPTPYFEPRFPVHRSIADRGGVYYLWIRDGRIGEPPSGTLLDSVDGTLKALDPLVVALLLAGYDVREVVVATSEFGVSQFLDAGYYSVSPRSGLGYSVPGPWPDFTHIANADSYYNVVALRLLAWRLPADPPVQPVSLDGVDGYQHYRDPTDPDGASADGWLVLGSTTGQQSSDLVVQVSPVALQGVLAAIAAAMPAVTDESVPPGLVRMFDPDGWNVPRERERPVAALRAAAELLWQERLRLPGGLDTFLGYDAKAKQFQLDAKQNQGRELLKATDATLAGTVMSDATDELELRAALLEPLEGSLPDVLARLWKTHWLLALVQLHEYGLVDVLPLPAPSPPAIPVVDLTGLYTSVTNESQGFVAALQLNQAGDELDGYWLDDDLEIWPVTGKFEPDKLSQGRFEFTLTSTWDGTLGSLYLQPPPSADAMSFGFYVSWQDSSVTWVMGRRDRTGRVQPALVAAALSKSRGTPIPEALLVPLHKVLRQRLDALGQTIVDQVEYVTSLIDVDASAAAKSMDGVVANLAETSKLARAATGGGYVETSLLTRLRVEVRLFVAARPIAAASGTDGWTQLVSVIAQYKNETPRIQALLDVRPGPWHSYEYSIAGVGSKGEVGLIAQGQFGKFKIFSDITHKLDCQGVDRDPNWTDTYRGEMYVGGFEAGKGGVDLVIVFYDTGTNDIPTPDEWTRDDFLCEFVTGELAGGPTLQPGVGEQGGGEGEAYAWFRGRDGAIVTGMGAGFFIEGGVGAKAGIGGGITGMWGSYTSRDGKGPPPPSQPPPPPPIQDLYGADEVIAHFDVDLATLTDAGRKAILALALAYRPLLADAGSYLIITGDASRTDDDAHNRDLSKRRALATYDYLRSLLTSPAIGSLGPSCALAVTDSHVMLTGYGELRPTWAGLPDKVENAGWRKATVVVNGRYVETLQAAAVLYTVEEAK